MRSPNLDLLYNNLHKQILLAQSYTEIPELFFVIKSCRLKPQQYMFEHKSEKIILYKDWFDEFGNSFHITKNKKIEIVKNDLSLDREKIVCTDLYYGLSIDRVAKISTLVYLCAGMDEDLHQDCYFLTFLGLDNYLRSYMFLYGEWQQVSSLLLGLDNLTLLSRNKNLQNFRRLLNKDNMPIPCTSVKGWLTSIPLENDFLEFLNNNHQMIYEIFRGAVIE